MRVKSVSFKPKVGYKGPRCCKSESLARSWKTNVLPISFVNALRIDWCHVVVVLRDIVATDSQCDSMKGTSSRALESKNLSFPSLWVSCCIFANAGTQICKNSRISRFREISSSPCFNTPPTLAADSINRSAIRIFSTVAPIAPSSGGRLNGAKILDDGSAISDEVMIKEIGNPLPSAFPTLIMSG